VVGGGITGITAAIDLARTGRFEVTLYEKRKHLGGLSDYFQWNGVLWDRFYHVILSTDTVLLDFLNDLGLNREIVWRETKSGFYGKGRLVSLSSSSDFVRFPFISIFQKLRLALGILYSANIKNPSKLDRIYVKEWLTRVFGRRVYENIWDPLLRSKLGDARHRTSAAFIWSSISRLYGARQSGSKKEMMGYVQGGYQTVFKAVEKRLGELRVKVIKSCEPEKIEISEGSDSGGLIKLVANGGVGTYDQVLFTIPCPAILKILNPTDVNSHPYWRNLQKVEYLGVICVLLVLKRGLSPYYVTNLLDTDLPFTGVIEVTNVVHPSEVGNHHLVYLPKYLPVDHPINHFSDEDITVQFKNKLQQMFPAMAEADILYTAVFRERYVQPLQELNFIGRDMGFRTPIDGVYVVNSSMIYNSTLNNNAAITLAKKAAAEIARYAVAVAVDSKKLSN
jgi:protoporphyrinogen oxidase